EVTVWRDGQVSTLIFADGKVIEKLKSRPASKDDKSHGTRVRAWPDGKYFDSAAIPMAELVRLLRSKAVLLPGVKVTLIQEKSGESQSWQYAQGLRGYLNEAIAQAGHGPEVIPPFEGEQYATGTGDDDSFAEGAMEKLVEGPVYTRPPIWRDLAVPEILTSGDHAKIAAWRLEQANSRTAQNRPDLLD
ncbi:MAG: hypothetical protein EBR84_03895, partial [Actinobacteria bacterium]|nr:hypothetical protein [Actinomycetota bacterium]